MKERTLTESHFNYANKFVKILGFDDLADYGRQVGYTVLKESQNEVCTALNKTLDVFKALFPQDGFNLRKIHYKFENIDQVLGFFKKVMGYLGIPYENIRARGAFYLRLIPQKTSLYNEYIYRMQKKREMPQKNILEPNLAPGKEIKSSDLYLLPDYVSSSLWFEPDEEVEFGPESMLPMGNQALQTHPTSSNPKLILSPWKSEANLPSGNLEYDQSLNLVKDNFIPKSNLLNDCIRFSHILQKENFPVVKNFLSGPEINLSNFKDFGYISSIEVFGLEGSKLCPLEQGTEIVACVGGNSLQKQTVSNPIESGSGFIFNLDFPNSFFYIYHELQLKIKNTRFSLFKINMKGKKFVKKYPTNKLIITDHDPKYYNSSTGYEWRIMSGMCGCSRSDETQISVDYEDILKNYFSNNQVTELKEIYPYPKPIEFNGIEIANKDNLESNWTLGLMLLVIYPKFYKSRCSFILTNSLHQLKFSFIETQPGTSTHSLYYHIERFFDSITKIEIPDNFSLDYQVTMDLYDGVDLIPIGIFEHSNRSVRLDKFYYLISRQYRDSFLIINVPSSELYQWLQINLIFGSVYLDSSERRHVTQNPGFV